MTKGRGYMKKGLLVSLEDDLTSVQERFSLARWPGGLFELFAILVHCAILLTVHIVDKEDEKKNE